MDNNQLEKLLKITASKLGTSPEALKAAAESGKMDSLLGRNKQSAAMQKVLSDPEAAKKMLSTPEAQKLFELLGGNKDNKK